MKREGFEFVNENGLSVRGEVVHPDSPKGSVIVCHGLKGFYRWGFFPIVIKSLAAAGFRSIAFNFSGSGVGPDGETFTETDAFFNDTYTRALADLVLVAREATARRWLGPRFALFGHSRGGGVAILHAALDSRVSALVTWSAISRVARYPQEAVELWRERGYIEVPNVRTGQILRVGVSALNEVEALGSDKLNIQKSAARLRMPWLIIHGSGDETVPVAEADVLFRAAPAQIAQREIIEGANHAFDVRHPASEPSPALADALGRTLQFLTRNFV